MRFGLIIAASVLLAACAGTPFTFDEARQVKVGMTEQQVMDLMGRPYSVVSKGDSQMWIWSHASAFGGSQVVSFELKDGKVITVPHIPGAFPAQGGSGQVIATPTTEPAQQPLSKEEYKKVQLQKLTDQNLPYEEYQKRYKEIMAQ